MKRAIVAGGGIAGILCALLQKKNYDEVVLIEQEEKIGGLLNSCQNEHGDWFDFGTHFIAGTSIEALNHLFLEKRWTDTWQTFPNEKAGNFFAGSLTNDCLFVDARKLSEPIYNKGMMELLQITGNKESFQNSEEELTHTFGETLTQHIFAPALKKLFGVDTLQKLVPGAHLRFGMKRLFGFTPETTRLLKNVPIYNDKLAFHTFSEGSSARPQFYPISGGAGEWIRFLERKLIEEGIEVKTSCRIDKVAMEGKKAKGIDLSTGENLACDHLSWTVPAFLLLKAAGMNQFPSVPPTMRKTGLVHYTLDTPPKTPCHFFFCYDPNFSPFRVTLYSNLQPLMTQETGRHRITVEVLSDKELDPSSADKVLEELKQMNIVDRNAKALFQKVEAIKQGFPVLDHAFVEGASKQLSYAKKSFENVYFAGKNVTSNWFMHEVLTSIWNDLSPKEDLRAIEQKLEAGH